MHCPLSPSRTQTVLFITLSADAITAGRLANGVLLWAAGDGELLLANLGWAVTMAYVSYITSVLLQLSWFLDIPILTLKPKEPVTGKEGRGAHGQEASSE